VFWVAFCHLRKTHHHLYHFRLLKCIYIYIYIYILVLPTLVIFLFFDWILFLFIWFHPLYISQFLRYYNSIFNQFFKHISL
jgi:hypothetical protein